MNSSAPSPAKTKKTPSKIRILIFIFQIALVMALLVLWLCSKSIQESKSLWVLFFYSLPSEFLIAIAPHEPVLVYFGKFYPPLTVALVAIAGTLIAETLNYSVFKFVTDTGTFNKIRNRKTVTKIVELFNKAPFIALIVAGFTPVPFYPFRFLAVLAHFPLTKYILAIFLARTPRFYLLALIGYVIKIPDYLLLLLFIVLAVTPYVPFLRKLLKNRKKAKSIT